MTDAVDLSVLLERPEGETLDFKARSYDLAIERHKRDFAKDLACLANTPREGNAYLVLGVKKHLDSSYEVPGIDKPVDDADLQGVASSLLEPVPRFSYEAVPHKGLILGLITIPEDQRSPVAPRRTLDDGFAKASIYFRRGSQNALATTHEQERIWDWFLNRTSPATPSRRHFDASALLLGPVQALNLTSRVGEAQRIEGSSPGDAAKLYAQVADSLRERFSGHADRFEQRQARALRAAGNPSVSHDLLMRLAIRDLFERAEPHLSPEVRHGLTELDGEVDEARQARGRAVVTFGDCHEYSGALQQLAECFDRLGPADEYAPAVAVLLTEAALASHAFQVILDRSDSLRKAGEGGDASLALRLRAALGDASVPGAWDELIKEAESFRLPAAEGTYACLRAGRWCAWNGQLDKAESLYRLAMKLGSEADLDLDIENALWSLTALYTLGDPSQELFETNRMALSIEGSHSFLKINSRTRHRSYQHIVKEELPAAHLWARYHLLESIRSGSLMDELESHSVLARIYGQSKEPINALEHAILGGSLGQVRELAPRTSDWLDSLPDMAGSRAPWVRHAAFSAIEHAGDFAPPKVARNLVSDLVHQLDDDSLDTRAVPALLNALGAIILEATDDDVSQLILLLEGIATREPGNLSDDRSGCDDLGCTSLSVPTRLQTTSRVDTRRDGHRGLHRRVVARARRVWGQHQRTLRSV